MKLYEYPTQLLKGTLIKRYKRFFADVQLESGELITAHCPNTGSMKSCIWEGAEVWVSHNPSPKRKLHYTWELVVVEGGHICVNTHLPNKLVFQAIQNKYIPELNNYEYMKREVKYGENSKIDILLTSAESKDCYVEIKNVTLAEGAIAKFPDSVTTRGLKHLNDLKSQVAKGDRAVMFYLINRPDVTSFEPAVGIDPKYAEGLKDAIKNGVEVLVYQTNITPEVVSLGTSLPYKIF